MSGNGQQHRGSIHPTNGSPQVTDPLSFASRFFQQIGDTDLSPDDDDDSRSDESENSDESDQDDDDNQSRTSHQPSRSNGRQGPTLPTFSPRIPQGLGQKELSIAAQDQHRDGFVAANSTKHPKDLDGAQRQQEGPEAKRTKLEAVVNLINSGISGRGDHQPTAATMTTSAAKENKTFLNQSDLAQFNFSNKAADDTNAAHIQSTLQYLQQQQQHKQQQQRQQHQQQQQQSTTSSRPTPQQLIQLHQQQQQHLQQQLRFQSTSPQHSPQQLTTPVVKTENGPKRPYSVGSSIASSTPSPTTIKGNGGGGVIDLTEEEATTISDDDEVVIDESKTTAIANRNLCFGMIQSLVVTLYPRHLDYIEGKSDRVIIKRATTANKASLAVEHEGGLVGCLRILSAHLKHNCAYCLFTQILTWTWFFLFIINSTVTLSRSWQRCLSLWWTRT